MSTFYRLTSNPIQKTTYEQLHQGREYQQGYTFTQRLFALYRDGDSKVMTIPVYSCGLEHPPSAIDDCESHMYCGP